MRKSILVASGFAAGLAFLVACGDEVTEVTKVSERSSLDTVKKFKELPECEEDIEGTLIYVKDSAKVYGCTSDGWIQVNGKNGEKGAKGAKGADGDSGTSCTAKQNKKKTGFDIVCDGKTIGTIKDGEKGDQGAKGADGDSGTNCTAKQNKAKTGFDIVCDGKTIGTIKNGDSGEDGDGCTLTEGDEKGQIVVTCGENSAILFRGSCGTGSYDPETQFCVDDKAYSICHNYSKGLESALNTDGTYNVKAYFCDVTDTLLSLCNGEPYDYTTQFCADYGIGAVNRCHKAPEGLDILDSTGLFDRTRYFCDQNDSVVALCNDKTYDTNDDFCDESGATPQVVAKCGGQTYELKTQMCVDGQVEQAVVCCAPSGQGENYCNGHKESQYDVRQKFCDSRDGNVYGYTVIDGRKWMTENLNYTKDVGDNINTATSKGPFYNWAVVTQNYCPNGWHVPTEDEFQSLINKFGREAPRFTSATEYTMLDLSRIGYVTSATTTSITKNWNGYYWTSTDCDNSEKCSATANAVQFKVVSSDITHESGSNRNKVEFTSGSKTGEFMTVRCIEDAPLAED